MRSDTFNTRRLLPVAGAVAALCAAVASLPAQASSHREAPFIAMHPTVDATDLYMFRSYEPGRSGFVTVIANYLPFQDPQGGPNFYQLNPNALYEIHLDNTGDGVEDLTFQFRFNSTSKGTKLTIGGKQVAIPLINSGQLDGSANPDTLDVRETYTVSLVRGGRRSAAGTPLTNATGGGTTFDKPVDNIGAKTFPGGYDAYAGKHVYGVNIPGCSTPGKVFVGQRKEPFYIAVGKTFDLFNLNPLGAEVGGNNNDLEGKNVTTLALELPISCITTAQRPGRRRLHHRQPAPGPPHQRLQQHRLERDRPGQGDEGRRRVDAGVAPGHAARQRGRHRHRRQGPLQRDQAEGRRRPLRRLRDQPGAAGADRDAVPCCQGAHELPAHRPGDGVPEGPRRRQPGQAGRHHGQPAHEMLRLNTAIAPTAAAAQSPLGVVAGDNAGFPNGRRPADDVVDLSLRVAMGALCVITGATDTLKVGCKPSDAPAGGLALTDGVRKTAANYGTAFPYLTTPLPGNLNPPAAAGTTFP